jgi:hypothetical protein
MYTREILPPIASPVEDGNPIIGTWSKAFERVDLQEIRKPYGFPLPRWVRDLRIKEWQSFSAYDDFFSLEALFCNVKMYRMAQIFLYDRKNEKTFFFRKIKPGTGWRLPVSLANSSLGSRSSDFFFRIHSWLDADTVKLDMNIESTKKHPSLTVHLAYNIKSRDISPMAVSLGFLPPRIMYAYKTLSPVRGDMVFSGKHISMRQDTCSGVFCDYKGFFPYRMHTTICSAAGNIEEKRRFGFHIAENQTKENNKNNENAMWINGKLTPLPPVLITMPNSPDEKWVIQDVEGMVDLTFTPKEQKISGKRLFITSTEFNVTLGFYNGMLVNSDGEQINIKNLMGMGEKLYLRV